jgi:NitT/TauT family transport system substrate-binding protein
MSSKRSRAHRNVIAAACFGLGALLTSGSAALAEDVLRTQVYPGSMVSLPVWVADDGGFCKKEGISCPASTIASGPLGMQALAAGSIEVSFASTDVLMQGAAHGNDVQLIVGHSANNIYMLSMRSDIDLGGKTYPDVMKEFVGKTVGVSARGAATEIQMHALLIGAGLAPDSVTYLAVGSPNTAYPAMVAKQIQAAVMWVPFNTICQATKVCNIAVDMTNGQGPPSLKGLNGAFETFIAERTFIAGHKQSIDAFIRALTEGDEWMQKPENFAKVREIAAKHASMGDLPNADALLDALVKSQIPTYSTKIDRAAVKAFSVFLADNKIIDQPFDTSRFVYDGAP